MTHADTATGMSAATPFVIACPICFGHVAATAGMAGRPGCCPLCAGAFLVPDPSRVVSAPALPPIERPAPAAVAPPAVAPPAPSVRVQPATQPFASRDEPSLASPAGPPEEPPAESPRQPEPQAGPASEPTSSAVQEAPVPAPWEPVPPFPEHVTESAAVEEPSPVHAPVADGTATAMPAAAPEAEPEQAITTWDEPTAETAPPLTDFLAGLSGAPAPAEPATPPVAAELAFTEPVRTVGRGEAAVELRRMTEEERRIRRGRRNILLLLVGAAVLIVIVVAFGMPKRRRR